MKANLTLLFHSLEGNTFELTQWSNDQYKYVVAATWCYRELGQGTIRSPHIMPVFQFMAFSTQWSNDPYKYLLQKRDVTVN